MKRYPKITEEQSCFFESASKALIFEILIDIMRCNYGDYETDSHFMDTLEKANKEGTIQSPILDEIPKTIKKARALKNFVAKNKK